MATTETRESIKGPIVLLKEAWAIYVKNPGTYALLILMTIVFSVVGVVVAFGLGLLLYAITQSIVLAVLIAVLVGIPVMIYLQVLVQVGFLKAIIADADGAKTNFAEALKGNKPLILPFFLVSLLSGFLTIGGIFLFLIPGILFTVWFSLYSYIFIVEGKRGFDALLTSREYIRGYTGVVFMYIVIFSIISYILSVAPNFIFEQLEMEFLSSIYSTILNFVIAPIGMLFSLGIYKELRRIKGEVKVENVQSRKWKYIGVGVVGFLIPVVVAIVMLSTFLPILNSIDLNELQNIPSEELIYQEAV